MGTKEGYVPMVLLTKGFLLTAGFSGMLGLVVFPLLKSAGLVH